MQKIAIAMAAACLAGGCTTNSGYDVATLTDKDTRSLCRIVAESSDQNYRHEAAELLVRRGATASKCAKLIEADSAMFATAAVVAGTALAAGVASSGGGGYYPTYGSYGVAWDQFYDAYNNLTWRCRDKSNGQFVYDYYCSGKSMVDSTWPGWRA